LAEFIVAPPGNRAIVCGYNIAGVAVFCTTTTGRPAVETIEQTPKRADGAAMSNRAPYNVYPREVEEALYEHPAVAAVAVIGIPHETLGEEVGAAVVLKAGAAAELEELEELEELRQFVKGRVAAYKYPRRIWFVDTLPTGPTGKLLRREVKPPPEEA
jgi:acyl-CoA synthetase (AMP-forming)/AMP-acid ligase II